MPSPACHRSARSRTPRTLSPLCGPAARSAASSGFDANRPACVAHGPDASVLPPACPTRRPQRISDGAGLSLLPSEPPARRRPAVRRRASRRLGPFRPAARRPRRARSGSPAGGRTVRVRLRPVTGGLGAPVRLWRLATGRLGAPIRLRLATGGREAPVSARGGGSPVRDRSRGAAGTVRAGPCPPTASCPSVPSVSRLAVCAADDLRLRRPPIPAGAGCRAICRAVARLAALPVAVRRRVGHALFGVPGLVRRCDVTGMRAR